MYSMKPYALGRNREIFKYRNAGILRRVIIYLEPFAYQLSAVWGLRVPCPTWLKIIFTAVLALMLVLPLLYPPLVLCATLAMVQVLSESDANIKFPVWMDVLGPLRKVLQVAPMNLSQSTELRRYVGRYALLISTFISCVEYIRIVQDFFDEL